MKQREEEIERLGNAEMERMHAAQRAVEEARRQQQEEDLQARRAVFADLEERSWAFLQDAKQCKRDHALDLQGLRSDVEDLEDQLRSVLAALCT